jgi:hypothetical protein
MHSKRYREWNAPWRTRNDSRDRENGAMEAKTTLGTPKNSLEMATLTLTPDVVLDAARRLRAGVGIRDRHAALLVAMCVCACLCV